MTNVYKIRLWEHVIVNWDRLDSDKLGTIYRVYPGTHFYWVGLR